MSNPNTNIFQYLKETKDLREYSLMTGVADFSNLAQFNMFEGGYPLIVMVNTPDFLTKLGEKNGKYSNLIENYIHVIQNEFRGLDGLDNITSSTSSITTGAEQYEMITNVTMQSSSTFTMRYYEKAGSLITKVHELFLRGIKDPKSKYKSYGGLVGLPSDDDANVPADTSKYVYTPATVGLEQETFSFLYMHTDNTGMALEKAVYVVGAQPTTAELSIYNAQRGDIDYKEVGVEMLGYPIFGVEVDNYAKQILQWLHSDDNKTVNRIITNSLNFQYSGVDDLAGALNTLKAAQAR